MGFPSRCAILLHPSRDDSLPCLFERGPCQSGMGVGSDVVKVEDEDPTTPGSSRENMARWYACDAFRVMDT